MEEEAVQLHAHTFTIAYNSYQKYSKLSDFFEVLATDTHEGVEFVIAVEAHNYPIAGTMHHPETQNIRVMPGGDEKALEGKVNTDITDEINFFFSQYLHN